MSCDKSFDQADDFVDPRVQIELERLNTATDEINKLEVDLDEARNQFRQLLYESTIRIENCAKKLGNCIEKARPYYDARLKAKEALQETQKAAVNFERANSAHAAAKEMVYLAEEGLKTEGRTFDHAWQEMLNHATMRVNESESDRTIAEAEHKRTSQIYQKAEIRVQTLQKDLKRAITKSRPYFELKIHYNQLLEQQKNKVKSLEKQVSEVKNCYAETLRNLEHISDEIHKTRQSNKNSSMKNDVGRSDGIKADTNLHLNNHPDLPRSLPGCAKMSKSFQNDSRNENNDKSKLGDEKFDPETGKLQLTHETSKLLTPLSETSTAKLTPNTSGSSQPDTDFWSESSDTGKEGTIDGDSCTGSGKSENDSSLTGPPDSESEDEFFKLPEKLGTMASPNVHKTMPYLTPSTEFKDIENNSNTIPLQNSISKPDIPNSKIPERFEGVGICSFPIETDLNIKFNEESHDNLNDKCNNDSCWTEIKLSSPEEEQFLTMRKGKSNKIKNELEEEEFDIPYAPLSEVEADFNGPQGLSSPDEKKTETDEESGNKSKLDNALANWIKSSKEEQANADGNDPKSSKNTPRKMNIRRQSLDVLWSNATGEKMKEILSQSIMKFNIGSLTERRSSESKIEPNDHYQNESAIENIKGNECSSYESSLTSQFGLQFFKKNSKAEDEISQALDEKKASSPPDTLSNQIGSFISKKERFFTKKVPSPLEKTLGYLNADEESNSDSESLASMDMLTDEQLSSLVLDLDLREIYQDIIS